PVHHLPSPNYTTRIRIPSLCGVLPNQTICRMQTARIFPVTFTPLVRAVLMPLVNFSIIVDMTLSTSTFSRVRKEPMLLRIPIRNDQRLQPNPVGIMSPLVLRVRMPPPYRLQISLCQRTVLQLPLLFLIGPVGL